MGEDSAFTFQSGGDCTPIDYRLGRKTIFSEGGGAT